MSDIENFILAIDKREIQFSELMQLIDENYTYQPAAFSNGVGSICVNNVAGENQGSCKLFAFAKLNNLSKEQTLLCFGEYYREDVLKHPEGDDHSNIRTFMKYGWDGIRFESDALVQK